MPSFPVYCAAITECDQVQPSETFNDVELDAVRDI